MDARTGPRRGQGGAGRWLAVLLVTVTERPTPPLNTDERSTLEGWLEFIRRVPAGEPCAPIDDPQADPDGPDGGFELTDGATLAAALATWQAEIDAARKVALQEI